MGWDFRSLNLHYVVYIYNYIIYVISSEFHPSCWLPHISPDFKHCTCQHLAFRFFITSHQSYVIINSSWSWNIFNLLNMLQVQQPLPVTPNDLHSLSKKNTKPTARNMTPAKKILHRFIDASQIPSLFQANKKNPPNFPPSKTPVSTNWNSRYSRSLEGEVAQPGGSSSPKRRGRTFPKKCVNYHQLEDIISQSIKTAWGVTW